MEGERSCWVTGLDSCFCFLFFVFSQPDIEFVGLDPATVSCEVMWTNVQLLFWGHVCTASDWISNKTKIYIIYNHTSNHLQAAKFIILQKKYLVNFDAKSLILKLTPEERVYPLYGGQIRTHIEPFEFNLNIVTVYWLFSLSIVLSEWSYCWSQPNSFLLLLHSESPPARGFYYEEEMQCVCHQVSIVTCNLLMFTVSVCQHVLLCNTLCCLRVCTWGNVKHFVLLSSYINSVWMGQTLYKI